MRCSIGVIAIVLSAALLPHAHAKDLQSRVVNDKTKPPAAQTQKTKQTGEPTPAVVKTHEKLDVTPEEKKKAAVAQQAATAEEQKIAGQLRGLQLLMQKEEQALAQRLAYAGKVRAQGLAKNDQKLLDQAERLERQALDYYQKRIKQFENYTVTSGQSKSNTKAKAKQQPTRRTGSSSTYRSSRSSSRYRTKR